MPYTQKNTDFFSVRASEAELKRRSMNLKRRTILTVVKTIRKDFSGQIFQMVCLAGQT